MKQLCKHIRSYTFFLSLFSICEATYADDTEVFFTPNIPPNVLIIIDSSGSMGTRANVTANYRNNFNLGTLYPNNPNIPTAGGNRRTRMQIVQDSVADLIANFNDVNIGITTFRGVLQNFTPLTANTPAQTRRNLINSVYSVNAGGGTPLTQALFTGHQIFTGASSPFQACQANAVVLFSDGAANGSSNINSRITPLLAGRNLPTSTTFPAGFALNPAPPNTPANPRLMSLGRCSGKCLDELAWYMGNTDLNTRLAGQHNIPVHTISGFGLNYNSSQLMISAAARSGGTFASATTPQQIRNALQTAVGLVPPRGSTLSPPSVPVSSFNVLSLTKDLYYPLFVPSTGAYWPGNFKHYKFNENGVIVDQNNTPAIDDGFFSSTSQSFWSRSADGNDVTRGGALDKLPQNRKLYTDVQVQGSTQTTLLNTQTNPQLYGITGNNPESERQAILSWINTRIGDPLHSGLQTITYYKNTSSPNNKLNDATAFFGSNLGFLHAFNVSTREVTTTQSGSTTITSQETSQSGEEQFAYIPSELITNLKQYRDSSLTTATQFNKVYGLDGPIDVWVNDKNGDGDILTSNGTNATPDSGEHAYLYAGMRRGGRTLYAFNVTNRSSPTLFWKKSNNDANYSELGFTWSKPKVMKIRWGSGSKVVLVFGGGYEANNSSRDIINNTSESTMGRAIYIADARDGSILWSAAHSSVNGASKKFAEMKYSIPGEISGIDVNGDDLVDKLFASDIGGQVWRFDIPLDKSTSVNASSITGGRIANFGGTTPTSARRFFEMPDVSFVQERGKPTYFIIALGSGNRAFPRSDSSISDRFYVFKNYNVFSEPSSYTTLNESNLYDATNNTIGTATGDAKTNAIKALNDKEGWFLSLSINGEKVLSRSTTFEGILMFTTYSPPTNLGLNNATCSGFDGQNRLYLINILDGTSFFSAADATGLDTENPNGRIIIKLASGGIPPTPFVYPKSDKKGYGKIIVGTEDVTKLKIGEKITKTFWRDNKNN